MRKAIAIDFDGCLCENEWPEIGAPHWPVIRAAQLAQREGTALILWTCRNGDLLDAAVKWCGERGLIFDAVNENLKERLEHYGGESRKISADEYWDDRAVRMPAPPTTPLTLEELRGMGEGWVWIKLLLPHYRMVSGYYLKQAKLSSAARFCCGYPGIVMRELLYSGYGDAWIAYRRKPEEG